MNEIGCAVFEMSPVLRYLFFSNVWEDVFAMSEPSRTLEIKNVHVVVVFCLFEGL